MENRAHALAAGVFVLVLAVTLVGGAFWLGGGATTQGVPYDLITQDSVAGLSTGAPVRLRGVDVGQVQSVGFDPSDPRRVRVRVLVDPKVRVMEGTHGTISYLALSGSAYIELDYPDTASRTLRTSADAPARIPMRASGLAQLTDAGEELVESARQTLHNVDAVLTPETARNVAQLVAHLNEASKEVMILTRDIQPAARHIDTVVTNLNDLLQSTRTTVRNVDSLIAGASARGGALDAVRESALSTGEAARDIDRALIYETLPRVDVLAERLSRTSDSLTQLLQQVRNQPQSFIFGLPRPSPGPGEPGFQRTGSK
jgi:phospholipid/cholesterol/gamma-HCH transport system substrate-binding protein